MLHLQQFLIKLGLTEKETALYLASLQSGEQTATLLARKTGIHRSTVNFVFDELIKKGFATKEMRGNATWYAALPPASIEYVLLQKVSAAKKEMADFLEILPAFGSLQNKMSLVPRVRYFEGINGLCRMLDDFCAVDQTVLYISGHNMMHPKIREYTYKVYIPISSRHANKNKIILNDGARAREYAKIASDAYDEFIFVDPKACAFTLTTAVYGNKTAFWSYDPADMTGVIIENQLISDNMRAVFFALKERFSNYSAQN